MNTRITTTEIKLTKPWFPHSFIWPRWLRWVEYQIRVKLFKQSSYFIDLWTIEEAVDMCSMHSPALEDELIKILNENK